jgi:hypothetical protein
MSGNVPTKRSTTEVSRGPFKPHGMVDIWMEGQIMVYRAQGPFNAELVDALAIAQRDYLLETRPQGAWVSMCIMRDNAMTSPEGLKRYAELMAGPKPDNMVPIATAFVIAPEVEGCRIMAPLYARVYTDIGRTFGMFETLTQACTWAQTLIDQANAGNSAST